MNTIVVNTLTGAVSEYDGFDFQSITPTHAGSVNGLYELGVDAPVVATVTTGKTLLGTSLKKFIELIYLALKGSGTSTATVVGEAGSYSYEFPVRANGESRAKPGRGIRENYLAFGYSNTDGADFQLDRIEVDITQSTTRRT